MFSTLKSSSIVLAFYKWIKEKLFRTDAETLYNNKEKINTNNIIKVVKDTFTQKPKDKPPSPTNEDIAKLLETRKSRDIFKELQEKKKENIRLNTELNLLNQSINPNFSRFTTPHSEGKKRMRSELFNQSWNNNINTQHIYQNQINSFTENGNNNKAEAAERLLNSLSDDDDKKKKTSN